MPDNDTSPRKPRGTRKASPAAFADDWPDVAPTTEVAAPPARQRVAKAMARAGLCSRRDAEAWILEGRVTVNGEVLASPARDVGPDDRVEVDGAPLPSPEKTRLFLFHKPRGLVTSDHDPEGRETIFDHLREHWPQGPRVVTVGRLDINTEGLLLLTNDGGLARMLELPKTGWLRRYRVRANGETDQAQLDALAGGITIEGVDYAGIEAKLDRTQGANCWLTMGLREGKNREVKRVLEHLGLEVNRLIRLSFGPFQLLDLEEGAVEEVRTRVLRDQLGAALAAEAGVDFGEATANAPAVVPARIARTAADDGRSTARSEGATPARIKRESDPRGARSAASGRRGDPRPQQSRANEARGDRPMRRREVPSSEERPRPRRHVSTLRTSEAEAAQSGPRKRVERTDTRDRHDRSVTVERKVSARPPGMSPSAEGKRARIARSGGARNLRDQPRETTRDRPGRSGDERAFARPSRSVGGADRTQRPRRDEGERAVPTRGRAAPRGVERGEARPPRATGGDRPQRTPRGGERSRPPRREDGERGAPARNRGTSGGDRRDTRPTRAPAGHDQSRGRREDGDRIGYAPRTGARPPRRNEDVDGSTSGRPPRGREGDRKREGRRDDDARPSKPRGAAGRIAGKGRPPGARPAPAPRTPGGRKPGGKPPRGGPPGRTKR